MILYPKLNDYFVFNLLLHISLEYQTEHAFIYIGNIADHLISMSI